MPETWPPEFSAFLGHVDGEARRLGEGLDAAGIAALLGDGVERQLGMLDLTLGVDRLGGIERLVDQFTADPHKLAQQSEIVDLASEVARADDGRAAAGQLRQIARAAQLLERRIGFEHRFERDGIGDHVAIDQLEDRIIDAPCSGS